MIKRENIILFCSANNDLTYILAFIERYPEQSHHVFVSGLKNCFDFGLSLNLPNTYFYYLESKLDKLRNPISWIFEFFNLQYIKIKYLKGFENCQVYFFTIYYDSIVISCVEYLRRRKNKIALGISMDEMPEKKCTDILTLMKRLIYRVHFVNYNLGMYQNFIGLPDSYINQKAIRRESIEFIELKNVWKKYSKKIEGEDKYILFIDADHDYAGMSQKSKNTAKILLQLLSTKNTFTKGHPRLGRTNFSKDFNFNELDRHLPLEFYNLSNCYAIIGFYSYALVNLSNMGLPVISLLSLFDFESSESKTLKINYLKSSFNDIFFPETITELDSILKYLNRI
jgi:hypothetical protein